MKYNHIKIEKKWQKKWEEDGIYSALEASEKEKYYCLIEFPYPSGDGLHVGHPRPYIGLDIIARKRRMEGKNVLYPIGWDAFGLPTENYAIKTGIHPKEVTKKNTENFKRQIKSLGISFDWKREINTTDPEYYKWTQWIFLQFFKKGLAYKAKMPINWCLSCKIGLANEEVVDGKCERCEGETEKREREQWMLKITAYAERLLKNLDSLDYLEQIKTQQRNWIGKSEGTEVYFKIEGHDTRIPVFTTRVDTIFSAAFLALAPDHALILTLREKIKNFTEVKGYVKEVLTRSEKERANTEREKTGVVLEGVYAVNPVNDKKIPVWVGDFVLGGYGTGAVFGDAHDERDFIMAKKYNIPLSVSVLPEDVDKRKDVQNLTTCFTEDGILVDSGEFTGLTSVEARKKITKWLENNNSGSTKVNYKLRDWVFSRQRYWGEPIPVVYCKKCGVVPLPEESLPLLLPDIKNYKPSDTGESPLANMNEWVHTTCPKCNGSAKRETDVMPNWAGSSWYFLRYADPHNGQEFASKNALKKWMPVDWYNGGMEHTTLHLLYSRFWNQFLFDIGVVPTEEPYKKRTSHGLILAEGGVKMSKSKGNVINPDDVVEKYGADTLRVYEMFMGPFNQAITWSDRDILGARKFLERVWQIVSNKEEGEVDKTVLHKTIEKVSSDIESMDFNTAISQMMICVNTLKNTGLSREDKKIFLRLLAPFAPHITEELWSLLGEKGSIHHTLWPVADQLHLKKETFTLAVGVNGKVRTALVVLPTATEDEILKQACSLPLIKKWVGEDPIQKTIYVKGRLINIITIKT